MRGDDQNQSALFSYLSAEQRVPADHPLRAIQAMSDEVLRGLSGRFEKLYSALGRPSIPPEKLLRALLLQVLYSIRSERMLIEQLNYNLLFRWFVGLSMDEEVWHATSFTTNRDRLLQGEIAAGFFQGVLAQARHRSLLSDEHFTVDGTLLRAWASEKSYQKKETPPTQGSGSRGNLLLRDTHASTTDPDAVMYRKGSSAYQLSHMAHLLMDNRSGLPVAAKVTAPTPQAEWMSALELLKRVTGGRKRTTVGGDKLYDAAQFVSGARAIQVTPHVHQYEGRASHIDKRTTRHAGYEISLKKRRTIEQIFGWLKTTALLRQVRHRGHALVQWNVLLALSAYTLVRLRNIQTFQPV
jgi:transposase